MRLIYNDIEKLVSDVKYIYEGRLTIAVITLVNDFKVIGYSSCMERNEYVQAVGEKLAYENAISKVWELEGYYLTRRER